MPRLLFFILAGLLTMGCAHSKDPYDGRLTEVAPELVSGCSLINVISENANAGDPFPWLATKKMIQRVKARAVQLRATHLVWLHKTELAAAAEAYRCPPPKKGP